MTSSGATTAPTIADASAIIDGVETTTAGKMLAGNLSATVAIDALDHRHRMECAIEGDTSTTAAIDALDHVHQMECAGDTSTTAAIDALVRALQAESVGDIMAETDVRVRPLPVGLPTVGVAVPLRLPRRLNPDLHLLLRHGMLIRERRRTKRWKSSLMTTMRSSP